MEIRLSSLVDLSQSISFQLIVVDPTFSNSSLIALDMDFFIACYKHTKRILFKAIICNFTLNNTRRGLKLSSFLKGILYDSKLVHRSVSILSCSKCIFHAQYVSLLIHFIHVLVQNLGREVPSTYAEEI